MTDRVVMNIVIDVGGDVRYVYAEALDLAALGPVQIRRASHVEPDAGGRWWADLSPVGGPRLGPFAHRTDAVSAEVAWLTSHWLAAAVEPSSNPRSLNEGRGRPNRDRADPRNNWVARPALCSRPAIVTPLPERSADSCRRPA